MSLITRTPKSEPRRVPSPPVRKNSAGSFDLQKEKFRTLSEQIPGPSNTWDNIPAETKFNPMVVQLQNPNTFQSLQHHNSTENGAMDSNSPSSSTASNADLGNGGDAEGVWSMDIDQAFQEALQIYPPCGRRKIILSEEGKMYGRNELIARYIKIRCGKTRTRKQVSSHIQVLARKKDRESKSKIKTQETKFDGEEVELQECKPQFRQPKTSLSPASSCLNISVPNGQMAPGQSVSSTHSRSSGGSSSSGGGMGPLTLDMANELLAAVGGSGASRPGPESSNNNMAATAALAAVAGIPASQMWPYSAATASSVLNNYYTASMMNDEKIYQQFAALASLPTTSQLPPRHLLQSSMPPVDPLGNSPEELIIASSKLILCGFTAYIEYSNGPLGQPHRVNLVNIPKVAEEPLEIIKLSDIQSKYPPILQELFERGPSDAFFLVKCWANVSFDMGEDSAQTVYAVDSFYESHINCDISVSTKVCSFGKSVVEKVEVYSPVDGPQGSAQTYNFRLEGSPMCDYMVRFIAELKKLEQQSELPTRKELMDSVLDNFTCLQVVTEKETEETLMVIAFIFEVANEPEPSCRTYRLVS